MKRFVVILFGIFLSAISYADTCTQSQIDLGNGECVDTKFSITTSNLSMNTEFRFYISATGTFYVDCGDDGILSNVAETNDVEGKKITRLDFSNPTYKCAYSTGGIKTIKFAGRATGYISAINATAVHFQDSATFIKQIDGCLGAIFPTLGTAKSQQPRFRNTFAYTKITSIPEELFKGVTGGNMDEVFLSTFANTEITSIPENLFAGFVQVRVGSFAQTFQNCKNLTNIPQKLFSNVSQKGDRTDWLFYRTFYGCSSLTHIPENLFANISVPSGQLFVETFSGCTSLSGIIPPSLFSGLITNNSPYITDMMKNTFANTNLDTTCPTGTTQYITGYEDYWDGKVSCVDESFTCDSGEYFPAHGYQCTTCPAGSACVGGTFNYSASVDQGITHCTGRTQYSAAGATSCSTVSARYYSTGCDENGNNCTGQSKCNGFVYCSNGVKYNCPNANEHKRITFPENYYEGLVITDWYSNGGNGWTNSEHCTLYNNIDGTRGKLIEKVGYNTETLKYDRVSWFAWMAVKAGYYLKSKADCGAYAYYRELAECPAGSYCPGKEKAVCNSSNAATVHTTTFGLESCPNDYPNSNVGATAENQCYLTTTPGQYVATQNALPVICAENGYCLGGINVYYGTTGGRDVCPNNGFSPTGSTVCYPHIFHVGDDVVYLRSTKLTTPSLNVKIGNDIFYANMTTTRTKMNKDSDRYFHAQWENNDYYICDDTTCPQ